MNSLLPGPCYGHLCTDTFRGLPVSLTARVLAAVVTRPTLPSLADLAPARLSSVPHLGPWLRLFPPPGMLCLNCLPASPLTCADLCPNVTLPTILYKVVPLPSPLPVPLFSEVYRAGLPNYNERSGERGLL